LLVPTGIQQSDVAASSGDAEVQEAYTNMQQDLNVATTNELP